MTYKTKGVCAQGIEFEIDDNKKVHSRNMTVLLLSIHNYHVIKTYAMRFNIPCVKRTLCSIASFSKAG